MGMLWVHIIALLFMMSFTTPALQEALDDLLHDRRLLEAQHHGSLNVTLSHGKPFDCR